TLTVQVSPISLGPIVPVRVTVSTWAVGRPLAMVLTPDAGAESALVTAPEARAAEVIAAVNVARGVSASMVKVPVLKAAAVTTGPTVTSVLMALMRASRASVAV